MPGVVERLDHRLELGDLLAAGGPLLAYSSCGAKKPMRVVAPVVAQAALDEEAIVHELVDREQLDGGDAQLDAGDRWQPDGPVPHRCRGAPAGMPGWRMVKPLTWTS